MNRNDSVEVLLVEDNPLDAELTVRALKKRNLVNPLLIVRDGAEALDFLFCRGEYASNAFPPNLKLILLDLKLPKVDGLEVLKAVKSDEALRKVPLVVLTSSREDPDIQRAYDLGANSYVVKPVNFENFSDCVSSLGLYWLIVNQPAQ